VDYFVVNWLQLRSSDLFVSQAIPVSKEFRTKLISSAFKLCRFLDRQISYSAILSYIAFYE
jgi:hypothetical protein